jgi:sulfur-carrier protein
MRTPEFSSFTSQTDATMTTDQPDRLTVTVKLFAAYQEAYGVPELTLNLPAGAVVATVRDRLLSDHPELEQWRDLTRFGVNLQFVEPHTPLENGDEVVLIPPVSGG